MATFYNYSILIRYQSIYIRKQIEPVKVHIDLRGHAPDKAEGIAVKGHRVFQLGKPFKITIFVGFISDFGCQGFHFFKPSSTAFITSWQANLLAASSSYSYDGEGNAYVNG